MITLSIDEILQGWDGNAGDSRIYLIRDDKLVFFVGILKRTILDYVLEHCGLVGNGRPADRLGRVISRMRPVLTAGRWTC